jgi:hypothetical protein
VNTVAECTVPEQILLAAHQLEDQGPSPFSAEAIIVASWKLFPNTFGLKGYIDQYPDSNKVLSSLMGERGLARRGWLIKMGQKLYAMTREGRQVVRRLQGLEPAAAGPEAPVQLSRDQEKFLLTLLASTAVEKCEENRKEELTFADACRFWGITENLHGEALDARLDKLRLNLADIDRLVGTGSADLSNGRSISATDLDVLSNVHKYLSDRFARHLTLLRNRVVRN